MNYITELKKIGVDGMFIGPHPSTKLRINVKNNLGNIETHEITSPKLHLFREYLETIQSGSLPIPEDFATEVIIKKEEREMPQLINDSYLLSDYEKKMLTLILQKRVSDSPKDIWERIKESGCDLRGKILGLYLKSAYLFLSERNNELKNDNSIRHEVEERIQIDGLSLSNSKTIENQQDLKSLLEKQTLSIEAINKLNQDIGTEISSIKEQLITFRKDLPIHLSDVQKNILLILNVLTEKDIEENRITAEEYHQMKNIIDQIIEAGHESFLLLNEMSKAKIAITLYLKRKYPSKNISANNLQKLNKSMMQEARVYFMLISGNKLTAKAICDNIFRGSRRKKPQGYSEIRNNPFTNYFGTEKDKNNVE